MRTTIILCLAIAALTILLVDTTQAQDESSVDCGQCGSHCYFVQGRAGECDEYGRCICDYCIFRACKKMCRRSQPGSVAQCDDTTCNCLS